MDAAGLSGQRRAVGGGQLPPAYAALRARGAEASSPHSRTQTARGIPWAAGRSRELETI